MFAVLCLRFLTRLNSNVTFDAQIILLKYTMQHKIGFWSVLSIVIGSQIGAGIFMNPAILAPYGYVGLAGWAITGGAALCLAIMFSLLCSRFPKTGGPHVYVQSAFGSHVAFFVGWAYWLVSWVSTTVVIVASIAY